MSVLYQGDVFQVNAAGNPIDPSVAALADGGFVVTWMSSQDAFHEGIYGQRYDASGTAQGGAFKVNSDNSVEVRAHSVAGLAGGGFVVTWTSDLQDGSVSNVYGQAYNASGTAQGGEFRVNSYTANDQLFPSVAALTGGGFVVTWDSYLQDGSSYGVYGQAYNASGTAQGGEFRVNSYTPNAQYYHSVAALAGGGFVVTWESAFQDGSSSYSVYGQAYNASGTGCCPN